jgi:heat shock protein HtpX
MAEPILHQAHNMYDQQRHNRRLTVVILACIILLFTFLGVGFDYFYLGIFQNGIDIPPVTTIALVMSIAFAIGSLNGGSSLVLQTTQAVESNPGNPQHQQALNVVQEMALAAGLPAPKLYVIPDEDPNAFATGKNPNSSSIAVTDGLLKMLDRDELQGVIAHEISHILYYDTRLMTTVAALVGMIVLFSDLALRGLRFGGLARGSRSKSKNPVAGLIFLLWIITLIVAPLLTRIMAMMISRRREYLADASAAELTRNPIALAQALAKLENASAPTQSIKRGIAHLCVVDPLGKPVNEKEGFWSDLFSTHPPMKKRIMLLQSMAYQNPH